MANIVAEGSQCRAEGLDRRSGGARNSVIIFAKSPVPGLVKTRVGKSVGYDAAASLYVECAEHVLTESVRVSLASCTICFSPPHQGHQISVWLWGLDLGGKVHAIRQVQAKDLGVRMVAALTASLDEGHDKAVLVGTDIPDISAAVIEQALNLLDRYQAVFGPALDGGFYLVGVTTLNASLFEGVQWSTGSTREQAVRSAEGLGLSVAPDDALPMLADLDTLQDIKSWTLSAELNSPDHAILRPCRRLLESAAS